MINDQILNDQITFNRLRFIDDNLYLFISYQRAIYHFKLKPSDKINERLHLQTTYQDEYLDTSYVIDIAVCRNFLYILFDKFIGIYKFISNGTLKLNIALQYSQDVIDPISFEYIYYDEMPIDTNCNQNNENKQNENNTVISTPTNLISTDKNKKVDNGNDEVYCEKEYMEYTNEKESKDAIIFKKTFQHYVFIETNKQIIAQHMSHSTCHYLNVIDNLYFNPDSLHYTISKRYGVFCIANNTIWNSLKLESSSMYQICNCLQLSSFIKKDIVSLQSIFYDELYGVNGRLVIYAKCMNNNNSNQQSEVEHQYCFCFISILNTDDLIQLKQEINKMTVKSSENYKIIIFEYLFGVELVSNLFLQNDNGDGNIGNVNNQFAVFTN